MTYYVRIDKDLCMSSGRCVAEAPEAFAFDDDELAEPAPGSGELDPERLMSIARQCPGAAITVFAEDGSAVAP